MSKGKKIVVFGSYVTDLTSVSPKIPVPGQTVIGSSFMTGPGGKGSNQAVAANRCGADVTMVTKVGKDAFGKLMTDFYKKENMDTDYVFVDDKLPTGAALIMVSSETAQNLITVIPGACQNITPEEVEKCRPLIKDAAIILFQMEINTDALYAAIRMAHEMGVTVAFNPAPAAPIPDEIMAMIDVITPNETEAQILTGVEVKDTASARKAAEVFKTKGVKNVIITLGSMGAYAFDGEKDELLGRLHVNAIDSTGAGDAFNGGFVTALSRGMDIFTALRYSNCVGALSVTKKGTAPAMPYEAEVDEMFRKSYGGEKE